MSSIAFSRDYSPPAPVLRVQLCVPDQAPRQATRTALVDTGADSTMVPLVLLEQLGIPVSHMVTVRAHVGDNVYRASVYQVDLIVNDQFRLPAVDAVSDDWGEEIILGRNAENKLRLFLNGPDRLTNVVD